MAFGCGTEQSAWSFGWDALAALGTLLAIGAALFVHFHQQIVTRKEEERRRGVRTIAVAPQLVADVMRLDWEIGRGMRTVMKASKHDLATCTGALIEGSANSALTLTVQPGAEVYGGDIEWLQDPVREKLAELKAQVSVCNAMWHRLLIQSFEPFASREEAVGELMKGAVHQLVDTHTSCIALLEVLDPYLPEPLKELRRTFEREAVSFLAIYNAVPLVQRQPKG